MRDPPFFVVGAARSGTTLLAGILGRHPRLFVAGEAHFFEDVYSRRARFGDPVDRAVARRIAARLATLYGRFNEPVDQRRIERLLEKPANLDRLLEASDYAAALDAFMRLQADALGRARWGNHVPKDVFFLGEIHDSFPGARVLICVRDPRDFLCSYRRQWQTATPESAERKRRLYHPILASLLWRASMKCAAAALAARPASFRVVRYESLVTNPEAEVREVCAFLDEPFDAEMLEVRGHNSSFDVDTDGIFDASVGRWRTELGREEVYLAQRVVGRELERAGYTRQAVRPHLPRLAALVCSLPYAAVRAAVASRHRRAPLLAYLTRRLGALLPR